MKATDDMATPRRDGFYEHRGIWGEVTIGTILGSGKRSEAWEVIEARSPNPWQDDTTPRFLIRELSTAATAVIEPRMHDAGVTILTMSPMDTAPLPVRPVTDAEEVALLVRELGAVELANWDAETGIVTCPDYVNHTHIPGIGGGQISAGLREHLQFAHGAGSDIVPADRVEIILYHGRLHSGRLPNPGGFPHMHGLTFRDLV